MGEWFLLLSISFLIIALIYASVGFGGGSSYLALLALAGFEFHFIRSTALLCNIIVVAGGTYIFYKEGKLDIRKSLAFILASIPLAFIGGYFKISETQFFITLGTILIISSIFLWIQPEKNAQPKSTNQLRNTALGGGIGFISGMVGIGGGIFLSPILHFIRWDEAKRISALASFFILVNSISGLAGQLQRHSNMEWKLVLPLLLSVFIGGQIGSRIGARVFNPVYVKRITAVLILLAGSKILYDTL
jgi:uncharacterized protein